jgi:phospholipase/lecithinase/hemolysin
MRRLFSLVCAVIALGLVAAPAAAGYTGLYVFGDSLSDSGNNALVFDSLNPPDRPRTDLPIPDNTFVPTFPYRSSLLTPGVLFDRYTNGFVWAELVANALGVPTAGLPSNSGFGTNFAFGGATTGPLDTFPPQFPASLQTQVATYLGATGNTADPNALYVVAGGGNNVRAALTAIQQNPSNLLTIVNTFATAYAADTFAMVDRLLDAGAANVLVWNAPDVGVSPAIIAQGASGLGTLVSASLNAAMQAQVWQLPGVIPFDLFTFVDQIVAQPSLFGLTDASNACAVSITCDPSGFLFWDGIHPTSAGHALIASAVVQVVAVPEPSVLLLLTTAIVLVVLRSKASAPVSGKA